MDAALLQTLLQAFVHREKVQTVDAALEQDIQLMLQIFFGKKGLESTITFNVKMLLTAYGYSQSSLAEAMGIGRSAMSLKMSGKTGWSVYDLVNASRFLKVSTEQLLDDSLMRRMGVSDDAEADMEKSAVSGGLSDDGTPVGARLRGGTREHPPVRRRQRAYRTPDPQHDAHAGGGTSPSPSGMMPAAPTPDGSSSGRRTAIRFPWRAWSRTAWSGNSAGSGRSCPISAAGIPSPDTPEVYVNSVFTHCSRIIP